MTPVHTGRYLFWLTMALTLDVSAGAQQNTLQHVRDLYTQAAYEEALNVLATLPATEAATDAGKLRAACFMALGRMDDARKAVVNVVEAHPQYLPDPAETSPRVVELFRTTRLQLLPQAARRLYAEGRAAMERKDADTAIARFEDVLGLASDAAVAGDTAISELKELAAGFLELTRAQLVQASAAERPARAPVLPAPPPIVAAVPIKQALPPWMPPDGSSQRADFTGAIRVRIGADGKVQMATIIDHIHPAYDALLIAAAKEWTYEPARQGDVAIVSERTIQVVLKPR